MHINIELRLGARHILISVIIKFGFGCVPRRAFDLRGLERVQFSDNTVQGNERWGEEERSFPISPSKYVSDKFRSAARGDRSIVSDVIPNVSRRDESAATRLSRHRRSSKRT